MCKTGSIIKEIGNYFCFLSAYLRTNGVCFGTSSILHKYHLCKTGSVIKQIRNYFCFLSYLRTNGVRFGTSSICATCGSCGYLWLLWLFAYKRSTRYYYILNFNSSFTYKVVYKITPYNNVGMCGIWCSISNSYIHMTLYFDNVLSAQRLQQQQPVFDLLLIKGNSCFFLGVLLTRSYMIFAPPTVNCSSNVHEFFFFKVCALRY